MRDAAGERLSVGEEAARYDTRAVLVEVRQDYRLERRERAALDDLRLTTAELARADETRPR